MQIHTWIGIVEMFGDLGTNSFWGAMRCGLFTNDFAPDAFTLQAALTSPVFAGYAKQNVDDSAPTLSLTAEGDMRVVFPHVIFQPTALLTPAVEIWGWYTEHDRDVNAVYEIMQIVKFDAPILLAGPTDILIVEPDWRVGQPRSG